MWDDVHKLRYEFIPFYMFLIAYLVTETRHSSKNCLLVTCLPCLRQFVSSMDRVKGNFTLQHKGRAGDFSNPVLCTLCIVDLEAAVHALWSMSIYLGQGCCFVCTAMAHPQTEKNQKGAVWPIFIFLPDGKCDCSHIPNEYTFQVCLYSWIYSIDLFA